MNHECYYCDQRFESKEQLYQHLEAHAKPADEQKNYKIRAKASRAARRSGKSIKQEGKVSSSKSKKKFTVSQKRSATVKKFRR